MKAIVLVLLLLSFVSPKSTFEKPNQIEKTVQFEALKPNFQVTEYFSLDTLSDELKVKEWYAFIVLYLPQTYFVEAFSVEIYTVVKETGAMSQRKVLCNGRGDHLSDCFIGSDRIDPTKELIVVKVDFLEQITGNLQMQISGVKDLKINERIVLYKGQENYTKIVRLNIKDYEEEFKFLYCELSQKPIPSFQEMYYFSAAYAQTPPDKNRYDQISSTLWDEHQQIGFSLIQLKQVELITMTLQTIGSGVYYFHCSAIRPENETLQLNLETPVYDIVNQYRTYHLSLPSERSNSSLYCVYLDIPLRIRFDITELEINHRLVDKIEARRTLRTTDTQIFPGVFKLWLNSTVQDVKFTVHFQIVNFITITVTKYDLSMIELKEGKVWDDSLVTNQTQHLFFTIEKNTGQQPVNFQVFISSIAHMQDISVKFYNCVDKSPEKCKEDLYSTNKTLRTVSLIEIRPKIEITPSKIEYSFKDLPLASMQTHNGNYLSIIVVEVRAVQDSIYFIAWRGTRNMQKINQNAVVRGTIAENDAKIYYFSVADATSLEFARVQFLPEGEAIIFGSNQLLDLNNTDSFNQENVTIYHIFDNSLHFPHLESRSKYYIYILGKEKCNYRLMLTFGYDIDANTNHTITFMTVGEQSKNHMLLQPGEVVFVQIKIASLWTFFHVQNSLPLRMCILQQEKPPMSHQDLIDSQECTDIRINTGLQMFRPNEPDRLFVGLQNKQTVPVAATLTTQRQLANCFPELLGQRHTLILDQNRSEGCVMYQVRHKAEIEVSTNLHNAKLEGFTYPVIHIGEELKIVMASSYKVLSPEEIEQGCKDQYQSCLIEIKIEALRRNGDGKIDPKDGRMSMVTVFAGETDKPLLLPEGVGHQTHLKQKLPLHFKFIIRTAQPVTVSLKADPRQIYKIYASIASLSYKLIYPNSSSYYSQIDHTNSTSDILKSDQNKNIGFTYLKVPTEMIEKHCEEGYQCFLLLTVECQKYISGQFTIQATQSISNLKIGTVEKSFLREGEVAFYHINPMSSASKLMVLLSSHGEVCHSMSISKGTDPFKNVLVKDKSSQLQVSTTKNTIYTVTVTASMDCYYSIQATTTSLQIKEMTYGFSQKFHLKRSQKDYFMVRVQNQQIVKVIGSISQDLPGQIILRAYAVPQQKMESFVALLSDKSQFQQKGLEYGWTDRNHIVLHHTDKQFCRYCLIFLEVESVQQSSGFLSLAFDKLETTYVTYQSTMYDILLKGQSFIWMFKYSNNYHSYQFHLQAGTLTIEVFEDQSLKDKKQLRFSDGANGSFTYTPIADTHGQYMRFRLTAKQNSDYSLAISRTKIDPEKQGNTYNSIEVGRPKRIYLSSIRPSYCLKGTITDLHQRFMFSLVNTKKRGSNRDSDQLAKQFKQHLQINGTLNEKQAQMKIELVKSTFLMSFQEGIAENSQHPFTICLTYNSTTAAMLEFIFIGNLNYFPENQLYYIKGQQNLTFMSEGRGFIEVDECQRRATLILTRKYSDLDKHISTISQRRVTNHMIEFTHSSSAYLRIESQDYTSLRWRNLHPQTYNGYGYEFYAASSFRINEDKDKRVSLTIKPLSVVEQNKNKLPEVVSVTYHIYIASQESGLYNAMNCERGNYMHWIRDVAREEMELDVEFLLNNVEDLVRTFKKDRYVLVIVKAEVELQWKNQQIQQYRFYYPYQELILHREESSDVEQLQPHNEEEQKTGSTIFWVLLVVVAIGLIGGVAAWSKRRSLTQNFLVEETVGGSEINAVELQKVNNQRG